MPNGKQEWLAYLETCHPKAIDLGLQRISKIARRLNVLHLNCPVITVAGTNGKGSCVALTLAILTAAGYRVGTYTSPHLWEYNERIQIAGQQVTDAALCDAFLQIEKVRGKDALTYFEFGTLAALWFFKQAQLDIIILEVGLGGRLDAVNCVDATMAVISMIDLDHQAWLGHTREQIAQEKAGIMRAHQPCIVGDFSCPQTIYEHANRLAVPLYLQNQTFAYEQHASTWTWKSQQQTLAHLPLPAIELQNAATVLQVIELLAKQFSIARLAIAEGLQHVFLPGRFQLIKKKSIPFIFDVAHNPAGGRWLANRVSQLSCLGKKHAIVGMLKDKDICNTLAPLVKQVDHWYLTDLQVPRGATAEQLSQSLTTLARAPLAISLFSSPLLAYQAACKAVQKDDQVLIFGSFHTVGPLLKE
jgi:dihydrofolate synthase / folylpolyglutamate synthase